MVFLIESWHPKIQSDRMTFDDYEVTATLPRNQALITMGLETNTESCGGQIRYKLNALKVRDFGLIASDRLVMVEGKAGDVSVKSYYLPDTERWGNPLLDFACDAITFYRKEFGFYPHTDMKAMA